MKNIIKIIGFLSIGMGLLILSGCENFLEEDLRDKIPTNTFFSNDAEALLAVNGLYRIWHNEALYGRRGLDNYNLYGADEVGPGRNINGVIYNYLIAEGVIADQDDLGDVWASLYEVVRNSDLDIANIEENEALSEKVRDQTLGEALFMRAFAYYHLTNLWGDVPYFRELLSLDELRTLERTDKTLIRTDMKADLDRAFALLPSTYSGKDLGRASKWAAATLKAKFHLYDREWALAKEECLKVINNSPHRLLDNYADVFDQSEVANQFNDEQIFIIDFTKDPLLSAGGSFLHTDDYNPRLRDEPKDRTERPNGPGTSQRWEIFKDVMAEYGEDMTGFGWAIVMPELADQNNWQEGDLRYDATVVKEYLGFELNSPYFRKNWNLNIVSSPRNNHPENYVVFRLADVYLMAAEAENEINGPANAFQYVNRVRERAFDPDVPWGGMSQLEFRESMYDERKFELSAEGQRKMDLIRWGILLDVVKSTEQKSWNNPADNIQPHHVKLPIPLTEILLNPNLLNTDPTNNGYR